MTNTVLQVRNWAVFQHYKDRNPPWIKLATDTFQNYEFSRLQDASKLLAVCIWTLAARSKDGSVPDDFAYIKAQGCLGDLVTEENMQELISSGFLVKASKSLAERKQTACPETEGEGETEKREKKKNVGEKSPPRFSDDDMAIAKEIFSGVCELNPKHKPPNMEKWADIVRLMRERDGRTHAEIRALWAWVHRDGFWMKNILSPDKLREKWDQLVIQSGTAKKPRDPFAGAI